MREGHTENRIGRVPERLLHLIGSVFHVHASSGVCAGQKVLDESHAHVVAQSFQLLVHIVHVLKVPKHLGDQSAVGKGQQF